MKNKLRYFIILVMAISIGYIAYSTKFINKGEYRTIAWEYLSQGSYFREKFQYTWEDAEVKRTSVNREEKGEFAFIRGAWSKANYYLNQLNGGYAVSVIFHIPGSNSGGPYVIYINPFTKQVIGTNSVID